MLQVLFFIFKLIGILFLIVLGLVLTAIFSVLFVPVRYRIDADYFHTQDFMASFRVTWLLWLIYIKAEIVNSDEEKMKHHIVVRILGIPLYDNLKPKRPHRKQNKSPVHIENEKPISDNNNIEPVQRIPTEPNRPPKQPVAAIPMEKAKKKNIFVRIREKLVAIWQGLLAKFKAFLTGLGKLADKKDALLNILTGKENQKSFTKIKRCFFRLVGHIQPTKLSGRLTLGFEDPAVTGYVVGLISLLYPVYTDHIDISPRFDEKVFEGHLFAKGRIRSCLFLVTLLQIIIDQDIKRILRSFKSI